MGLNVLGFDPCQGQEMFLFSRTFGGCPLTSTYCQC